MKWEPADVIRLVALIGGLLLFGLGALMMWKGIAAEGAIDIKSSVMSGTIKTGSAGLFIAFLSFVTIVFVLSSLGKRATGTYSPSALHARTSRAGIVFFVVLAAFLISGALAALGFGQGFGALA